MSITLNDTIGSSYPTDPEDVWTVKSALSDLGYYEAPATYGMTPWPDTPMFESIKSFQKDHGLEVDGIMKPEGPTLATMNGRLAQAEKSSPDGGEQLAYSPAAASLLDMVMQRRSKGGGGGNFCPGDRGPSSEEDCDRLKDVDDDICRNLPLPRLRSPCFSSAQDRYSACRHGRPMPPLNTGDW